MEENGLTAIFFWSLLRKLLAWMTWGNRNGALWSKCQGASLDQ